MRFPAVTLACLLPLLATAVLADDPTAPSASPTPASAGAAPAPAPGSAPASTPSHKDTTATNATAPTAPNLAALKKCGENCVNVAARRAGCKDADDTACWCKSQKFADSASKCIQKHCQEALPFVYPQLENGCSAAKQNVTFTWPNVTTAAGAQSPHGSSNATSSGPGATNSTGTTLGAGSDSNDTSSSVPNVGSPANGGVTAPASGAGQGVDFALGALSSVVAVSLGVAVLA